MFHINVNVQLWATLQFHLLFFECIWIALKPPKLADPTVNPVKCQSCLKKYLQKKFKNMHTKNCECTNMDENELKHHMKMIVLHVIYVVKISNLATPCILFTEQFVSYEAMRKK